MSQTAINILFITGARINPTPGGGGPLP